MSQPVTLATLDTIAIITIDNPPVNALSPGVPEGILACVEQFESDESLRAAVLICAGKTFIAGADIHEFQRITRGERDPDLGLNAILNYVEACSKPIVCAIHGTALGGGLEVAMACHFRIAAAGAKFGQPEVKLGLIPGAGGTQRLPRLVGVAKAAEMCALGEPIDAVEARRRGLVSSIEEGDLLEAAVAYARFLVKKGIRPRRTREQEGKLPGEVMARTILDQVLTSVRQKWPDRTAPVHALAAVWFAVSKPFDEGLAEEARRFRECLYSEESKGLVAEFFAQRAAKKAGGEPGGKG
jgi:3-hydroxyacyl-CoA dehydrogenase